MNCILAIILSCVAAEPLKRTGDPRLVDDGRFFETPPMAGSVRK
jgi:hypothetical protein